jgi:DNA-directed RNA polymerase
MVEDAVDIAANLVYMYSRGSEQIQFTELIADIGRAILAKIGHSPCTLSSVHCGAFVLYELEVAGLITSEIGQGKNGHGAFVVTVKELTLLQRLWSAIPVRHTDKLPRTIPYERWTNFTHKSGVPLVKSRCSEIATQLTPSLCPIMYNSLNKSQETGWKVNEVILKYGKHLLKKEAKAFDSIFKQQKQQAKISKLRETQCLFTIADKMKGAPFYHLYYYDFRGRKNCKTAYLNEMGSDVAKSLLIRAVKAPIGEEGYFWLMLSIASLWGGDAGREDGRKTDKIGSQARFQWSVDNEDTLLSYAEKPYVNIGWMSADKPWQFIAACNELMQLRIWQTYNGGDYTSYGYESGLCVFIDGSNNGSQHLAALTKDEITASRVNLVPSEYPGDLYAYVAESVWEGIRDRINLATVERSLEVIADLNKLVSEMVALPQGSPERNTHFAILKEYREAYKEDIKEASAVFWAQLVSESQRRKVVKRNVMTMPYGSTAYGKGVQQYEDAKKLGIEHLNFVEKTWCSYLGKLVHEDSINTIEKPMHLLKMFSEAGKLAEADGRFLQWTVPVTNFPVVQYYMKGVTKRVHVAYGNKVGRPSSSGYYSCDRYLSVCFTEILEPAKGKQESGASPNITHSLDAAHLAITVDKCDFYVTTIHDSYGCLLKDMPVLYKVVRESFVELYKADPLTLILKDIGVNPEDVPLGTLDIADILLSEYCFI